LTTNASVQIRSSIVRVQRKKERIAQMHKGQIVHFVPSILNDIKLQFKQDQHSGETVKGQSLGQHLFRIVH